MPEKIIAHAYGVADEVRVGWVKQPDGSFAAPAEIPSFLSSLPEFVL